MKEGKITEIAYKRSVLKNISDKSEDIKPGVDAIGMEIEDVTVVMSSNCILKWFDYCEDYFVQKTINGISEKGGEPLYIQLEICIPTDFDERKLVEIITKLNNSAEKRKLKICQCRIYAKLISEPIAHITVLGTTKFKLSRSEMRPGMDVVMADTVAVGGISIISHKYKEKLSEKFSRSFLCDCLGLREHLSIEKAAHKAVQKGAVAMHSVSDGGIFGAVWELASSADLGITVDISKMPIWQETVEVAEAFDINPYTADGTGALLIVTRDGESMKDMLLDSGIIADVIGSITSGRDRIAINGDEKRFLEPQRGDEIYRFL